MRKFVQSIILSGLSLLAIACNTGENNATVTDSAEVPSAADTMPVLEPGDFDTGGIIKTPSVNDNNVIVPDTNTPTQ